MTEMKFIACLAMLALLGSSCQTPNGNGVNSDGYMMVLTQELRNSNGTLTDRWTTNYDSSGRVLSQVDTDTSNSIKNTSYFTYNALGKWTSKSTYSATNVLTANYGYEYDTTGNVSRINYFLVSNGVTTGSLNGYSMYSYGVNGKSKTENYGPGDVLVNSTTFSYLSSGNRARSDRSDGSYATWVSTSSTTSVVTQYDVTGSVLSTRNITYTRGKYTQNDLGLFDL